MADSVHVAAESSAGLTDLLRRVIDSVARAGATWQVTVTGSPESVRYAAECAGLAAALRPRARGLAATVRADQLVCLLDSWTPSLHVDAWIDLDAGRFRIGRAEAERAELGPVELLPATAATAAQRAGVDVAPPAAPRRQGRPRHARTAVALAAALAAALVLGVVLHAALARHTSDAHHSVASHAADGFPTVTAAALASDPRDGTVVMAACCDSAERVVVWTWSSAGWSRAPSSTGAPPFTRGAAFAFDPDMGEFVLQGGDGTAATWTWDGRRWQQLTPRAQPPPGAGVAVFDDSAHLLVLALDGPYDVGTARTWTWDGRDWKPIPGTGPLILGGAVAATYDATHRDVVLVDGTGSPASAAQTWTYDGTGWSALEDAAEVPSDPSTQLAWDARSGHVIAVLLGATAQPASGIVVPAETWTWDGSAWSPPSPGLAPAEPGRLVSWRGTPLFIGDAQGSTPPDLATWTGAGWILEGPTAALPRAGSATPGR